MVMIVSCILVKHIESRKQITNPFEHQFIREKETKGELVIML